MNNTVTVDEVRFANGTTSVHLTSKFRNKNPRLVSDLTSRIPNNSLKLYYTLSHKKGSLTFLAVTLVCIVGF